MFRELRRLRKLSESGEGQIRFEGFTPETLDKRIEKERRKVTKELNSVGWVLVIIFIFPTALMQLGMSIESASFTSYMVSGIVLWVLHKLTGKLF